MGAVLAGGRPQQTCQKWGGVERSSASMGEALEGAEEGKGLLPLNLFRVKIYKLSSEEDNVGKWSERGTGTVSLEFMEVRQFGTLVSLCAMQWHPSPPCA